MQPNFLSLFQIGASVRSIAGVFLSLFVSYGLPVFSSFKIKVCEKLYLVLTALQGGVATIFPEVPQSFSKRDETDTNHEMDPSLVLLFFVIPLIVILNTGSVNEKELGREELLVHHIPARYQSQSLPQFSTHVKQTTCCMKKDYQPNSDQAQF